MTQGPVICRQEILLRVDVSKGLMLLWCWPIVSLHELHMTTHSASACWNGGHTTCGNADDLGLFKMLFKMFAKTCVCLTVRLSLSYTDHNRNLEAACMLLGLQDATQLHKGLVHFSLVDVFMLRASYGKRESHNK